MDRQDKKHNRSWGQDLKPCLYGTLGRHLGTGSTINGDVDFPADGGGHEGLAAELQCRLTAGLGGMTSGDFHAAKTQTEQNRKTKDF